MSKDAIIRSYQWLCHVVTMGKWELIKESGGLDPSKIDDIMKTDYRRFYPTGDVLFLGIPSYREKAITMIGNTTPDPELVVLCVPSTFIADHGFDLDYPAEWPIETWDNVAGEDKIAAKAIRMARTCSDPRLFALILDKTGKLACFQKIPLELIKAEVVANPEHGQTAALDWGSEG